MTRRIGAFLLCIVCAFSVASAAAQKKHAWVWSAGWFQARGEAFTNVVIIIYANCEQPRNLQEAVNCPGAIKATIRGDVFLAAGDSYEGTLDEGGKLVLQYTNEKGKAKSKTFRVFTSGWTTPDQIR